MAGSRILVCATVLVMGTTGCGGGDADSDLQAFCDQAEALDELEGPPTDDDLARLVEVAPEEISDDVEILVASAEEFAAGNENAADSDEIQAAGKRFDSYIEENCPEG